MALTTDPIAPARFGLVTFDLYKDIHKGIRAELFAVTGTAGNTDPADRAGRCSLAAHVSDVHRLLEEHAEHEDYAVQPHIEAHFPDLAAQIASDHGAFERAGANLVALAQDAATAAPGDERRLVHQLYLDLAKFTSTYLAHQDLEERVIMPGLEAAIGVDAVIGVHHQIIGAIPPDVMARSLALMLPAMNADDRTELLGGMRADAPPEVFEGVWSLAGSVLSPTDVAIIAARLGLP